MKIPVRYRVGQQDMNVEYRDGDELVGNLGRCHLAKGKVLISTDQTRSSMENTFMHEALHSALDAAGYFEQSNDEAFVSSVAAMLLEIVNTAEYDKE